MAKKRGEEARAKHRSAREVGSTFRLPTGDAEKAHNAWGTIRRLMGYLGKYPLSLLGVIVLVIASTGFDVIGPYLMSVAIDEYIASGDLSGLLRTVLLMVGTYLATALTAWLQVYVMAGVAQFAVRDMRNDFFLSLQRLPLRFFDQKAHGDTLSRLTNDLDNVSSTLTESVTSFLTSVLTVASVAAMMLWINMPLALISLTTFLLMLSLISQIAKHSRRGFREQQQALGALNGIVEENISGARVVVAYGRGDAAIEHFAAANDKLVKAETRAQFFGTVMPPLTVFVNTMGLAIVAGIGGYMAVQGDVTVGVIAAFISYVRRFGLPLGQIANLYNTIQSAIAGAERVFETIDETPEPPDAPNAVVLDKVKGEVVFDNVCFGYKKDIPVLKNVSLRVELGQTFALVGPTGAGKTTIVNLLTRFYDIDSGNIYIDGCEIRQIQRQNLRRQLSIVLQDTFLFGDTVMENIRYGRLGATDDEVIAAAKLANADAFIRQLPHGYATNLSERGSNLSQGQRQMLSIARAILANRPILILDEATSSVDTRTEMNIQQALLRLVEGRTSFVIAHRLSTIRNVDQILVLREGEIVERGSHEALLDARGFYHQVYMSQFKNPLS